MYKIGIDVGGTNTDAVLIDEKGTIISKTKTLTTEDVTSGIFNAASIVVKQASVNVSQITHVMLGTTHCTNAVVERKGLNNIAVIRIGLPASEAIPPLADYPDDLKKMLGEFVYMIKGGYEFDGREIHTLDEDAIYRIAKEIKGKVNSIAVVGIFCQSNNAHEIRTAEILQKELPGVSVSLSCHIGSLGLLERENATIMNASLHDVAGKMVQAFSQAMKKIGIDAKLYIGQNDGTVMSLEVARNLPVLSISCGPTNSIRGASALGNIENALVLDVGGTTTDAGVLVKGFPRESSISADIGGIKTNFRMPDVISIGLGGGTIVKKTEQRIEVGPKSVGYRLKENAISFGGSEFVLTDLMILDGKISIEGSLSIDELKKKLQEKGFGENEIAKVRQIIQDKIEYLIDMLKTDYHDIPVVIVGGGAPIIPKTIRGVSQIITPPHHEVANAFGSAVTKISGESECYINLLEQTREVGIEITKKKAMAMALEAGASKESIDVLHIESVALSYLPNAMKIKVKVCGELAS